MVVKQKTTKLPKITQLLEKALLKDIEETGLAFDEIALVQLCNKKEIIYGEPSSEIRRAIQKYCTSLDCTVCMYLLNNYSLYCLYRSNGYYY
jgi:hypothetical protein